MLIKWNDTTSSLFQGFKSIFSWYLVPVCEYFLWSDAMRWEIIAPIQT